MAEGLNRVMLLGNLGADAELRYTQNGQAILHLRLAINESYLDKDKVRRERVEWVSVTVFGKRGEALGKILTKGSSLFVEGALRTSSYDDRDGNKKYRTEVVATNVILAGGKGRGDAGPEGNSGDDGARGSGGNSGRPQGQGRGDGSGRPQGQAPRENRPQGGGGGGGGGRAPAPQDPGFADNDGGYGEQGGDDDIPFICLATSLRRA